ncbi:AMP-dependent synthetase/ligase [Kitasatospora aureofaciens]|uniref:AMP-dependent synthetase n=1 Tax=Kitasatospora aureofaciens TaxID=1894 RepID=A0A1E7MY48_KITAU|nr:long-chain fatty acid--CoA ligase [Kitasatospora aureofaciens]ARF80445.1 long-chain fatty acid--CoA ligase [Kitasatospora aureofaciens]OEV33344.1 AMP-dependent synthetase [Kitasatospora aureofaciens]GGU96754.1 AMP-dependent synthetase [Kitasatospora aureofaciens]
MSSAQSLIDSGKADIVAGRPASVAHLFLERVAATPNHEAYRHPVTVDEQAADGAPGAEQWRSLTWAQTAVRVKAVAAGLMALGIQPEDRVALAASTRLEWILADLGAMCAGAAITTIYPSTNADETAFILSNSGSRAMFAENAAQLAKAVDHIDQLPELRTVILFDVPAGAPRPETLRTAGLDLITLAELERRGAEYLEQHPDAVEKAVAALDREQLATLIYTSGTTGRPKGVRLVHDCWAYEGKAQEASGLLGPDDVQFMWLPLSHVFGKTLISGQIATGHVMAVDGRVDRIIHNLPVIRPTVMASAPRIFEKVYNGIAGRARAEGGAKYKIFMWAAQVAREYARVVQENRIATGAESAPLGLRLQHALADKLVYAKIRAAFGGRMRGAVSGSAALAPEIGYFFLGAGVPILEGYGLSETSAGSCVNRKEDVRIGTVGRALPGTEVRIAEDGEILLRGPGVMRGYHNLPEKTAEVLEPDGWFHTEDIGELSPDGFLRITDRKKDLFKTSGGKYVAPSEVEGKFKAVCPFVSNILVIGNGRNYCTALIGLDESVLMPWAADHGLAGKSYAELAVEPAVHQLIEGFVKRVNGDLQRWQTIKKFHLLPRDLDIEHGELTPSLKIKRPVVERTYADAVAAMYAGTNEA